MSTISASLTIQILFVIVIAAAPQRSTSTATACATIPIITRTQSLTSSLQSSSLSTPLYRKKISSCCGCNICCCCCMNGISLPPSASPSVSSLWSTFYTQSPLFSNDLPTALHARRNQRRQYLDNDYDGVVGKGGGGDTRQGIFAREYLSQPPPITKTLPLQQPVPCMEHKKPVLVVGATGRVGRRVVQQLLTQNIPVRAYVRNYDKAIQIFHNGASDNFNQDRQRIDDVNEEEEDAILPNDDSSRSTSSSLPPLLNIAVGDLNNDDNDDYNDLERAVKGCSAIISVSGTIRSTKLTDILLPWRIFRTNVTKWCKKPASGARHTAAMIQDEDELLKEHQQHHRHHPYFVNYIGQVKLIELAERYNVTKFIRLTDLYVGMPAFSPVAILVNAFRSMTFRYHALTERALRNSTVPYIIVRPGDLSDYDRDTESTSIQICPSGVLPSPSMIGRTDLASVIVAAFLTDDTRNYTIAARWAGEHMYPQAQGTMDDGHLNAVECFKALKELPDIEPLPEEQVWRGRIKPFAPCVALVVYSSIILFGRFAFQVGKNSVNSLERR